MMGKLLADMDPDEIDELQEKISSSISEYLPEDANFVFIVTPDIADAIEKNPNENTSVLLCTNVNKIMAVAILKSFGDLLEQEIIEAN